MLACIKYYNISKGLLIQVCATLDSRTLNLNQPPPPSPLPCQSEKKEELGVLRTRRYPAPGACFRAAHIFPFLPCVSFCFLSWLTSVFIVRFLYDFQCNHVSVHTKVQMYTLHLKWLKLFKSPNSPALHKLCETLYTKLGVSSFCKSRDMAKNKIDRYRFLSISCRAWQVIDDSI